MQLIGLILLIATSWYIWNLTSKFLDEPTKKELSDGYNIFQLQFENLKKRFSKDNLNKIWEKYKEEANSKKNSEN